MWKFEKNVVNSVTFVTSSCKVTRSSLVIHNHTIDHWSKLFNQQLVISYGNRSIPNSISLSNTNMCEWFGPLVFSHPVNIYYTQSRIIGKWKVPFTIYPVTLDFSHHTLFVYFSLILTHVCQLGVHCQINTLRTCTL